MTLPNGAHVKIGSAFYRLDESRTNLGIYPYRRYSRSLFSQSSVIEGRPGAENINPDQLIWHISDFEGEGQLVLDPSDDFLARRFYQSEGLNARQAGQLSLNPATVLQFPQDGSGGATSTIEGSSFTDVTGTSTTVNTNDKRLNILNDEIASTAFTPGAGKCTVSFFIYQEGVQLTTIEGSAMLLVDGTGKVSGTDFQLDKEGSTCRTVGLDVGTDLTAGKSYVVNFWAYESTAATHPPKAIFKVVDTTDPNNHQTVVAGGVTPVDDTSTTLQASLPFTPKTGHTYQFRTIYYNGPSDEVVRLMVDKVTYGIATDPNDAVRIVIYNSTGAAEVSGTAQTINVTNTSTLNVVSATFTAAAATDYKARVRWTAGSQRPVVDKVVTLVAGTNAWTLDAIELGLGGAVFLVGHRSGVDSVFWRYDFSANNWGTAVAGTITGASNKTCVGLCHTDKYEYALMSDNIVYQLTASASDDYTAAMSGSATAVGVAICQNRLGVLCEDATNGVTLRTFAVDADVSGGATAQLSSITITSAKNTAETTLRQRLIGTPTGFRFAVNYSDVTCVLYEVDTSAAAPVATEIGRLPVGTKATSLCYDGGLTFIGGQFLAETGQTPRSAMWVMDQNKQVIRAGYFRRNSPDGSVPEQMVPYQNDIWVQQGTKIWRYSAVTGGLFLEYELSPSTAANEVGIAVIQGHQFAVYSDQGVFTTGAVGTYRSAGNANANQLITSIWDFGLPQVQKQLYTISVLTDALTNSDVKVEYQIDQNGTWTIAGDATTGSFNELPVSSEVNTVLFSNLQLRITLGSTTGANTPVLKAVIVKAFPAQFEEFFDLQLRCLDEDSFDHISGQQMDGAARFRNLQGLWQSAALTTFIDGYDSKTEGDAPNYVVRVEQFDEVSEMLGEKYTRAVLRVLA